jgi:hypothetical protein
MLKKNSKKNLKILIFDSWELTKKTDYSQIAKSHQA